MNLRRLLWLLLYLWAMFYPWNHPIIMHPTPPVPFTADEMP